jgi:hypothetical protein
MPNDLRRRLRSCVTTENTRRWRLPSRLSQLPFRLLPSTVIMDMPGFTVTAEPPVMRPARRTAASRPAPQRLRPPDARVRRYTGASRDALNRRNDGRCASAAPAADGTLSFICSAFRNILSGIRRKQPGKKDGRRRHPPGGIVCSLDGPAIAGSDVAYF